MTASRPALASVPSARVRSLTNAPVAAGKYVLYWMIAARRSNWNFALQRAVHLARELKRPLLVLEGLRVDYPYASDRFHRFVLDGMRDNQARFAKAKVDYYPYVEPAPGAARGLLESLAREACAVVTDDYPCFFLPRMLARASKDVQVAFEAVDSNGILPLGHTRAAFARAYDFRRYLQRELRPHLQVLPAEDPLTGLALTPGVGLAREARKRWPEPPAELWNGDAAELARLPVDHRVLPCSVRGGPVAAQQLLKRFVQERLGSYAEDRNDAAADATSELSPYLHFGHISAHQIFAQITEHERWSVAKLAQGASGKREGWWGMGAGAEAFLDQLITWRELGFAACQHSQDYARYAGLPEWAKATLKLHRKDRRDPAYNLGQLERAATHDELWNAAQRQLRQSGRIHNYLRMLWGKKILHWGADPEAAFEIAVKLNDKYALDGRDPNSYSGISWVFGKYDRAWGPEREIFGTVRYMSSDNTRRKLDVSSYLKRWSAEPGLFAD